VNEPKYTPTRVREWRDVDAKQFREQIAGSNQPAVLRGAIRGWPAVHEALKSPHAIAEYLLSLEQGGAVPLLIGDPSINGRFFYRDDMRGQNFSRRPAPLAAGLQGLLENLDNPEPPAIYIESAPLPHCLPTFAKQQRLELLDESVVPRIWIGNSVKVQTHYDLFSNIACVVAGQRRFTLFPPDQLANLYVGPMDFTPSGVPVSMVPLDKPDFERYPRFRQALANAQVADLEAGDALFVPFAWWHHVESLTPFNVLVNYWWNDSQPALSLRECLLHGVFAFRDLPSEQRMVWRNLFDYFVFQTNGEPLAHLPPEHRGLMAARGAESLNEVRRILRQALSQP
jgi:hypothetical protein